jgi:hypothetical protein
MEGVLGYIKLPSRFHLLNGLTAESAELQGKNKKLPG